MDPKDHFPANSRLQSAEEAVSRNVERLESSLEQLAIRLEESGRRLKRSLELASRSGHELARIKDDFVQAAEPLRPYLHRASAAGRRVTTSMRRHPRPVLLTLAGLAGGLLLWSYFAVRSRPDDALTPSLTV